MAGRACARAGGAGRRPAPSVSLCRAGGDGRALGGVRARVPGHGRAGLDRKSRRRRGGHAHAPRPPLPHPLDRGLGPGLGVPPARGGDGSPPGRGGRRIRYLARWYRYGLALGGLLLLLNRAAGLLRPDLGERRRRGATNDHSRWTRGHPWGSGDGAGGAGPVGEPLERLGHRLGRGRGAGPARERPRADAEDALSLLRPVYLFLALGISVAVTLSALPRCCSMVWGACWAWRGRGRRGIAGPGHGRAGERLARIWPQLGLPPPGHSPGRCPAGAAPTGGRARLYTYLVALIALGVLATGAGGLLWTLADAVTSAPRTINRADWWREQVSLCHARRRRIARLAPALGPRLRPGRPSLDGGRAGGFSPPAVPLPYPVDRGARPARGGAAAAKQLLDLTLDEAATSGALTNLARAVAVAAVSGVTVFYHQRLARATHLAGPGPEPSGLRGDEGIPEGVVTEREGPGIPSPQRPFGLISRRGTAEASEWFATGAEASSPLQRVRNAGSSVTWAAVVRLEERLDGPAGQVPSGPTGPGAPRATEAPPGT